MEKIHSRMFYTIFLPIIVWTAFIVYGLIHFVYFAPYQEPLEALSAMSHSLWGKVLIALLVANLYQLHSYLSSTNLHCNLAIFFNPYNIDAHYRRGIHLYDKKEFIAALKDFQEVTRLLPTHPDAFVYVGLIHKVNGEIIDAIAAFTNALNLDSKNWYACYHRGCCKFDRNDFGGALNDLERAIEIAPKKIDPHYIQGYCYQKLDKYAEAIKEFDVILAKNVTDTNALLWRGSCYRLAHDLEKAISDLTATIALDPQCIAAYQTRGIAYYELGDQTAAVEDFLHVAEITPNEPAAWLNLAKAYRECGDTEKSKYYLDKATELNPNDPYVMFDHAVHQFYQNDLSTLDEMERVIEAYPDQIEFLIIRVQVLMRQGEYQRAIADLDMLIANKPNQWKHYVDRAQCRVKTGDLTGAVNDCRILLQRDSKHAEECANIGQQIRTGSFWAESLTLHQAIVELSPRCWQAWIGLADTARHLENTELYVQALEQTRKWLPTHDPYNLACLESVADNLPLAKEYLLIAFNEKPQCKALAKEDPDLFWLRQASSSSELF